MGNCWCCTRRKHKAPQRQVVLACLGIDSAGKTTCLKIIKGENPRNVLSTNGFSVIEMEFDKDFHVKVYDVGGNERIRDIWSNYYGECHGIIFVIDASSNTRTEENCQVLKRVLESENVKGKPMLLILNRLNPNVFDEIEFTNRTGLHTTAQNNRQHFFIAHMDEYTGHLDRARNTVPIWERSKKHPSSTLDGFVLMMRKVIENYVELNQSVRQAEEQLRQRQEEERNRRRARLAEIEMRREQEERGEISIPEGQLSERRHGTLPMDASSVHSHEIQPSSPIRPPPKPPRIPMTAGSLSEGTLDSARDSKENETTLYDMAPEDIHETETRPSTSKLRRPSHISQRLEKVSLDSSTKSDGSGLLEGEIIGMTRPLPRLPPLNLDGVQAPVDIQERHPPPLPYTVHPTSNAFEMPERPISRKRTRIQRIKSGLALRRRIVVDQEPKRHETTTASFYDSKMPSYHKNRDPDEPGPSYQFAQEPHVEVVSAKHKRINSNTSLKSFQPNGSIKNQAIDSIEGHPLGPGTVSYSKEHDTVSVTSKRGSIGYSNLAFQNDEREVVT